VTERAVVAILNQLEEDGIIVRHREGRRNTYSIDYEGLRRFPRWSGGSWRVPGPLVEMAVRGLKALGGG
jgi:DNA-binding PadR family transcriptional regulator